MSKSPQGWEEKKLGDVCEMTYGYTEKAKIKGDYRFVRITDTDKMGLLTQENKMYVNTFNDVKKYLLADGDLLMARTGASAGNLMLFEGDEKAIFASYLIRIKFRKEIVSKFYWYFSKSELYWKQVNQLSAGSAQPQFNGGVLKQIVFSYPKSITEQKRIVAILDKAFESITKAKENAEKNLNNSKEIFDSYLQSVFEKRGEGWEEKMLGDEHLIEIIDGDRGKNYPAKKDFFDKGFCLFMNTKNVRPDGFEFNTKMFINEAKDKAMGKGKLERNDVVMTTRGTIGNLGIYNDKVKYDNIRINSGMLIFRPNLNQITPEYLFEILRSSIIKEQINKLVSGAAQPQLPIKTLVNFTFPVPKSLQEQHLIVKKLDQLSQQTKSLSSIYTKKIQDLEELQKSILQKAFNGELTP